MCRVFICSAGECKDLVLERRGIGDAGLIVIMRL